MNCPFFLEHSTFITNLSFSTTWQMIFYSQQIYRAAVTSQRWEMVECVAIFKQVWCHYRGEWADCWM